MDIWTLVMDFFEVWGRWFLAFLGLGLSYIVNRQYSGVALSFALICLALFFFYSDTLFIYLGVLGIIIGFFLKNQGL